MFLFDYFKKKEDSHFIEFIFQKILTFQQFIFINLMVFNIVFSFDKIL